MADVLPAIFLALIGICVCLWAASRPHTPVERRTLLDLLKGGDE